MNNVEAYSSFLKVHLRVHTALTRFYCSKMTEPVAAATEKLANTTIEEKDKGAASSSAPKFDGTYKYE